MVKLVVRLSRGAKIAALVAFAGGIIAIYGKLKGVGAASLIGGIMLFGGAIFYYVARFRMMRRR